MNLCYEEYSSDKKRRFHIYQCDNYYLVKIEQYHDEYDCMGYIEPAGFYEVRDNMIHHVGTIEEGILVGKEMMRNTN